MSKMNIVDEMNEIPEDEELWLAAVTHQSYCVANPDEERDVFESSKAFLSATEDM